MADVHCDESCGKEARESVEDSTLETKVNKNFAAEADKRDVDLPLCYAKACESVANIPKNDGASENICAAEACENVEYLPKETKENDACTAETRGSDDDLPVESNDNENRAAETSETIEYLSIESNGNESCAKAVESVEDLQVEAKENVNCYAEACESADEILIHSTENICAEKTGGGIEDLPVEPKENENSYIRCILSCVVCKTSLHELVILRCLHLLCKECLIKVIKLNDTTELGKDKLLLRCQACNYLTDMHCTGNEKAVIEHIMQFLSPSQVVLTLLDSCERKNEQECTPCKNRGKTTQSTCWCFDCNSYLCEECFTFHSVLEILKNHKIYHKDEMGDTLLYSKAREKCDKHGSRLTRLCLLSESVCCDVCISHEHMNLCDGDHKNITEVSALVDSKMLAMKNSVRTLIEELNDEILETDQVLSNVEEIFGQYLTLINKTFDDVRQNILAKTNLFYVETNKVASSQLQEIKSKVTTLHQKKSILQNAKNIVSISLTGSDIHSFLEKKKVKRTISDVQEFTDAAAKEQVQGISVVFETPLEELSILREFGVVRKIQHVLEPRFFQFGQHTFSLLKTIDIEEDDSHVTGCDWLSENEVIIVDTNSEVRIYNTQSDSRKRKATLEHKPYDIAVVSSTKCVITFPNINKIMVYNLPDLLKARDIDVSFPCFGVCHLNSGITIVAGENNLVLLDREFKESKRLKVPGTNIRYVCACNNNLIYYSEMKGNSIYSVMGNGQQRFKNSVSGMKGAAGILLDENKNIYVCEKASKYLHVLDKKGSIINKIEVGLNPTTLSMSHQKNRICIVRGGRNNKNIADIYVKSDAQ